MDQKPLSSSTKATEMKDWEEIGYHPRDVNENELHREARGGKSPSSPGRGPDGGGRAPGAKWRAVPRSDWEPPPGVDTQEAGRATSKVCLPDLQSG